MESTRFGSRRSLTYRNCNGLLSPVLEPLSSGRHQASIDDSLAPYSERLHGCTARFCPLRPVNPY